jgi:ABC-2 type transport system permease protein
MRRRRGGVKLLTGELRGIYYILLKDLKAYYFKPPNISWGILFPSVLTLAFSLRSPNGLRELAPGLIAMAAVFGTTSMEAIVITFEKRIGALERLILAPISTNSILIGKILGGAVFGAMISGIMTFISLIIFEMKLVKPLLFVATITLTLLTLSSLGALLALSVKEVFEAQTLSNYFRFPMIFLCGVFIPIEAMPPILRMIAYALPLTYTIDSLRVASMGESAILGANFDLIMLSLFLIFFLFFSNRLLKRIFE